MKLITAWIIGNEDQMGQDFIFERVRKSTRSDNEIVVQGYCSQEFLDSYSIVVDYKQDNHGIEAKWEIMVSGITAFGRLEINDIDICHKVSVVVTLPRKKGPHDILSIDATRKDTGDTIPLWRGNIRDIIKVLKSINVTVSSVIDDGEELTIKGWAIDNRELDIIACKDSHGNKELRDAAIARLERDDVVAQFPEYKGDTFVGFVMYCPLESRRVYLQVSDRQGRRKVIRRILWLEKDANLDLKTKLKKSYVKLHDYRQNMGNEATFRKIKTKLGKLTKTSKPSYDKWIKERVRARLSRIGEESYKEQLLPEGYVLLTEKGTRLTKDAMYHFSQMLSMGDYKIVYSDNDEYSMSEGRISYERPSFKPDYNLDLLRGYNYIGDTFVVSRELLRECGLLDKQLTRTDKHNILLVAAEKNVGVAHIPQILYHEKKDNTDKEAYDIDNGRELLQAHYDRLGIKARVEAISEAKTMESTLDTGYYRTIYNVTGNPKVSIIIPNKDHIQDLDKCIASICKKGGYDNYEIIIVENNSEKQETFKYYKTLEGKDNIRVITWDREFNYSAINNYGVEHSAGEYILLMNNDTEIISQDAIKQLLGCCQRDDVGAVGGRLYYEDGTIQHAGVVIGLGGIAGHLFAGQEEKCGIHQGRSLVACDYSAVTAACLMVSRKDYLKVEGLDTEFKVAFNDVDFCLKLRELGKLVVYNPEVRLYHYESKSRGSEDTPGRMDRFLGEIERFMHKWPKLIKDGDPYYNRNLALDKTNYEIKY